MLINCFGKSWHGFLMFHNNLERCSSLGIQNSTWGHSSFIQCLPDIGYRPGKGSPPDQHQGNSSSSLFRSWESRHSYIPGRILSFPIQLKNRARDSQWQTPSSSQRKDSKDSNTIIFSEWFLWLFTFCSVIPTFGKGRSNTWAEELIGALRKRGRDWNLIRLRIRMRFRKK